MELPMVMTGTDKQKDQQNKSLEITQATVNDYNNNFP